MVVVITRTHASEASREERRRDKRRSRGEEVMNQAGPSREHWNASLVSRGATHQGAVNGLNCESTKLGESARRYRGHHLHDRREKEEKRGDSRGR
jgi:hypothetical protein